MLELPRVLWTVFWKSRDLVQTVEKKLDQKYVFISAKKHFENIFQHFDFQIFHRKKRTIFKFLKIKISDFRKCRKFRKLSTFSKIQHFRFSKFSKFSFFRWTIWKSKIWKIFSKKKFAEMKTYFWPSFFSTVWTKSLDF